MGTTYQDFLKPQSPTPNPDEEGLELQDDSVLDGLKALLGSSQMAFGMTGGGGLGSLSKLWPLRNNKSFWAANELQNWKPGRERPLTELVTGESGGGRNLWPKDTQGVRSGNLPLHEADTKPSLNALAPLIAFLMGAQEQQ